LQGVINEMFGRFVEVVRAGRPRMTEQSVNALQDGRIVTAGAALSMGMVDRVGYLEDAVEEAKALARIEKAEVVAFRKNYNVNLLAARGGEAPSAQVASAVLEGLRALSLPRAPGFYYLWAPGL
jgi:protease-4